MGKNNTNKKKNTVQNLGSSVMSMGFGDDYMMLQSRGRTTSQPKTSKIASAEFDLDEMSQMLDEMEDAVTAGNYNKGMKALDAALVEKFIGEYSTAVSAGKADKTFHGMVRKFLSICKSYYEYDTDCRVPILDCTYDGLLAKYLACGNIEPTGIIPKGSRLVKKTEIRYPRLHNNVDKSYAILSTDKIPDGVKESDTVEQFLYRTYRALGLSPNADLTLELSPKVDGMSVNGTISKDMLIDPQTRGDADQSISVIGLNGLQVSANHMADTEFGIQYELFVTKEDAKKAASILGLADPYASCRHAASGILRRLCTMEHDELCTCISMYPIATDGLDGTYEERMDYLSNFAIVPKDMLPRMTITGTMSQLLDRIRTQFKYMGSPDVRENLSYDIDGMVITVANSENQNAIGRVGRTNKYQIALKFDPANAVGVVDHVELDLGMKGYRTPQIYLAKPVYLDNVMYDHVPVLSVNLFNRLGLRVGSKVNVHRVGDVIPSITMIEEGNGKKLELPKVCPKCGRDLIVRNMKLYCSNEQCEGNLVGKFAQFFSKLGMDGYGTAFAEMLVKTMRCKCLGDVLALTEDAFAEFGVTTVLATQFSEIVRQKLTNAEDYEVLGALGLPGVGIAKAKIILSKCPFNQLGEQTHMTYQTLAKAAVGDNYDALYDALTSPDFKLTLHELDNYPIHINHDFTAKTRVGHTGADLSAKTVALCRRLGFEVVDGKAFDILITSDMGSTSGKMEAAKKKGCPIYLERDFITRYEEEITITPEMQEAVTAVVSAVAHFFSRTYSKKIS